MNSAMTKVKVIIRTSLRGEGLRMLLCPTRVLNMARKPHISFSLSSKIKILNMYNEARNNHEAYAKSMRRFAEEVPIRHMTYRSWVVKEELREVYGRSTQKKKLRMRQKGPDIQFYCVHNISECLISLIYD